MLRMFFNRENADLLSHGGEGGTTETRWHRGAQREFSLRENRAAAFLSRLLHRCLTSISQVLSALPACYKVPHAAPTLELWNT